MRIRPFLIVLVAAASLTSAVVPIASAGGLPVCNAKHKRPANPYGSVLSEGLKPALAASASASPDAGMAKSGNGLSPQAASSPPMSEHEQAASLKPCGQGQP